MHGDSLGQLDGQDQSSRERRDLLSARVQAVAKASVKHQTIRDGLALNLSDVETEVEQLGNKVDVLTKVGELLRILMDRLVLDQVKSIESIVTEGLKTIFFDQNLSFEAEVGTSRNKVSIDLLMRQKREDKVDVVGDPRSTFGGGPQSIASLTLRILALLRLKKWPLLLLDETLAAISEAYVGQSGKFLETLARTTGIPIFLVTHQEAFLEHATSAYNASIEEDDGPLVLRRIRGAK